MFAHGHSKTMLNQFPLYVHVIFQVASIVHGLKDDVREDGGIIR